MISLTTVTYLKDATFVGICKHRDILNTGDQYSAVYLLNGTLYALDVDLASSKEEALELVKSQESINLCPITSNTLEIV